MKGKEQWKSSTVAEHLDIATSVAKVASSVKIPRCADVLQDMRSKACKRSSRESRLIQLLATPDAILKVEQIFEWLRWLEDPECKLVLQKAGRVSWKVICKDLRCDRTAAWRKWMLALTKISSRLNEQHS